MTPSYPWREAPDGEYAVIGDPVAHSQSDRMHGAAYAALGLPHRYRKVWVPPGEVALALAHLRELGYRGVNVTVPHKAEALAWSREPDPLAVRIGAANTLDLDAGRATNTDAPGFCDTLPDDLPNRKALVLGAGGSARAVLAALEGWEVSVWNRTPARAAAMIAELGVEARLASQPSAAGFGLIVDTTSAALGGDAVAVDWIGAPSGALACELIYGKPSAFRDSAAAHGLRTMDGRPLLAAQGARAFLWWMPETQSSLAEIFQIMRGALE